MRQKATIIGIEIVRRAITIEREIRERSKEIILKINKKYGAIGNREMFNIVIAILAKLIIR